MQKKQYKEVINEVITALYDQFDGKTNREIINLIFDHIQENNMIEDFSITSLYNTIYYFLRKRNVFKVDEIKYRFDSIDSKLKFLDSLRNDLDERWWFYHDLFFGDINRPVLAANTQVVSGCLNYIIESNKGGAYDFLYTMLYFRDLRKIVISDMCTTFVKKQLNEKLYTIFDDLNDLDRLVFDMVKSLDADQLKKFKSLIVNHFNFLSDFDSFEYNQFNARMIRLVNGFKQFIKSTEYPEVLDYNQNRFFDSITFCNVVYCCAMSCMELESEFEPYKSIHYLVSSTTNYIFFKFAKKLKDTHYNKLIDFFNSDLFFSYNKYIIDYYECFQNEARSILDSANQDTDMIMDEFNIILRYMLYNKLRNLINSNLKRFIGVDFTVNEDSFIDVDEIKDNEAFGYSLYSQSEPEKELASACLHSVYENFFQKHCEVNKDDVTNVAVDICNGSNLGKYDQATIKAGMELITLMREKA